MKIFYIILFYFSFISSIQAECSASSDKLIVLLKLDDLSDDVDSRKNLRIAKRWEKITSFLESNSLDASYGIIGSSLESNNEKYFEWIKTRQRNGNIEIWNHGYDNKFIPNHSAGEMGEFEGVTSDKQLHSLQKTQELAREKLGISLNGFGPHSSAIDKNTFNQLDKLLEISYVWFYQPVDQKHHRQVIINRVVELETPIFHPNFDAFQKSFYSRNSSLKYIAMQGHPASWDDDGFDSFVKIISWLRDKNAVFCKPSEFVKINR